MRNLQILSRYQNILEDIGDDTVTSVAIDEYGTQIFVYTLNHKLIVYKANDSNFTSPVKIAEHIFDQFIQSEIGVFIVNMEYVQELASVVMAFNTGEIHFYEMESKEAKEAGVLSGNILAAKWSPNEEHYAVASENGTLYLFTPDFDILYECPIDDGDLTFKDGIMPENEDDMEVSQAHISWRGDSSIF